MSSGAGGRVESNKRANGPAGAPSCHCVAFGRGDTMARMTEPRTNVTVRMSTAGLAAIDVLAAAEDRTRSQVVRMLCAEALAARARKNRTP